MGDPKLSSGAANARKPSRLEWAVLALAAGSSMLVLASIIWRVQVDGLTWSGSIGGLLEDTMQYVTWSRDASHHVLVGNDYTLAPASRNYLHPGILISGLLYRAGLSLPLSYAIWVPVAAALICWGTFSFVSENMDRSGQRTVALTLALFYAFPAFLIVSLLPEDQRWIFRTIAQEPQTLSPLWGYPYSAMAVGLTALGVATYIRNRRQGRSFSPLLVVCVVLTGWLQPWQGATVIATLTASELLLQSSRFSSLVPTRRRTWMLAASAAAAGVLPLIYYALLGRLDSTFIESERNLMELAGAETWELILLAVLPLAVPALLVLRMQVTSVAGLTARIWPVMAIGQAMVLGGFNIASSPSHALRGVAIPLSVLAVIGASNLLRGDHHRARVTVALAGLVLFAAAGTAVGQRDQVRTVFGSGLESKSAHYFISQDELDAYRWLAASPVKGGVLGDRNNLGSMVPWRTGRKVWAGHVSWSPHSRTRFNATQTVLTGLPCCTNELLKLDSGRFVQASGARFVLVACWLPVEKILKELGSAVDSVHRFGCVTVIQVRPGTSPSDKAAVDEIYGASSGR